MPAELNKTRLKKIKNWSWMLMMAYMLGIAKPYREEEEESLVSIESRLQTKDTDEEPPIGIGQLTYQEAEFYHRTGFGYFPRN